MQYQRISDPTQVNQSARHKLFVEGSDEQEIDPVVIKELLDNNDLTSIQVSIMGGCDNVRSAAQALVYDHSFYYFLIDRDDRNQETVDSSWDAFPDISTYNMLIWHKREFENYFIAPEYIGKSNFLKSNVDLEKRILNECNRRIFLDAANLTLLSMSRELQKPLAIPHFGDTSRFLNQESGLLELDSLAVRFSDRQQNIQHLLNIECIKQRYQDIIQELSGGILPLQYGTGQWLERMSGKEIFRTIANQCFKVEDRDGNLINGKEQNNIIAKQLVKLPLEEQPLDFQRLVNLLRQRIES